MCVSKDKIKVELYLTAEDLVKVSKFLEKLGKETSVTANQLSAKDDGGESGKGSNG